MQEIIKYIDKISTYRFSDSTSPNDMIIIQCNPELTIGCVVYTQNIELASNMTRTHSIFTTNEFNNNNSCET